VIRFFSSSKRKKSFAGQFVEGKERENRCKFDCGKLIFIRMEKISPDRRPTLPSRIQAAGWSRNDEEA
jgi:hypothetical protein